MEKNKFKLKKRDLSITVLLLIGILIVVNFFSYNIFNRFDLTDNKIYSISDASKKTVKELDDVVNIKAYFSGTLPSQLLTLRQEVEDLLAEYSAYSGGKIKVEVINPDNDEKLKQELYYKGIPELTFEVVEKDKQQLVKGYMGITINYGEKSEVIPALKQDSSNLEYQLTTKIKKVVSEEIPVIGFVTSHGTQDAEQALGNVRTSLREVYTVKDIELSEKDPKIDDDVKTLVIAGPKEKFNEAQQKAINTYLSKGNALFVMYDGVAIGEGLSATANESDLTGLLEKYGIKINKDLVADPQSGMASFSQGIFSFSTPYPFWPKVIGNGFASDYSAVSGLENVILPWASSVSVDENKITNAKINNLLQSSERSWVVSENFQIMPNQPLTPGSEQKRRVLAASVNGEFKNAFPKEGEPEKFQTKIIVLGDSDFATNGFVGNNPDNMNLFLNLVDSISMDEDLIEIRSKTGSARPIDETNLDDSKRATLRYLNVFGVTVLVIAFGTARYFMRRKSRFIDDF